MAFVLGMVGGMVRPRNLRRDHIGGAHMNPTTTLTIVATGLEHDGLPLILIPGDGIFTVEEVAG